MSTKATNENKANIINHLLLVSGLFYKNELIELNSCGYDIQKKQISTETAFYIQPDSIQNIKELMEKSQIDRNKDPNPQYISLEETINKLNKIIKENYTSKNHNFAVIYVNKDLVDILNDKLEVKNFSSFNIFDTFNDYYHKKYETLNKILSELNLKQNSNAPPCPKELKTMARIINKMVKEGKIFYAQEVKENSNKQNLNNKTNKSKSPKNTFLVFNTININLGHSNNQKRNRTPKIQVMKNVNYLNNEFFLEPVKLTNYMNKGFDKKKTISTSKKKKNQVKNKNSKEIKKNNLSHNKI
jgi:uncharacterized protein YlbG (UPF0298 family)